MNGFPTGYFKIRNRLNGKCIDTNGGSIKKGTRVILFNCHNGVSQQWYADGAGRIINRLSNLALEISHSDVSNGTAVEISNANGGQNQQWYIDSSNRIKSKLGGKCITFDEHNTGEILPTYVLG